MSKPTKTEQLDNGAVLSPEEQTARIAELEDKISEQGKAINDLLITLEEKEIAMAEAGAEILKLSAIYATAPKNASVLPSIEHQGKNYSFTIARFRYNGELIKATDAAQNAELCAELITLGFGGLTEQ